MIQIFLYISCIKLLMMRSFYLKGKVPWKSKNYSRRTLANFRCSTTKRWLLLEPFRLGRVRQRSCITWRKDLHTGKRLKCKTSAWVFFREYVSHITFMGHKRSSLNCWLKEWDYLSLQYSNRYTCLLGENSFGSYWLYFYL